MTRDDLKLKIGLIVAIIVGLSTLSTGMVQTLGLPNAIIPALPWCRLAAFVIGVVTAHLRSSPLPSKVEQPPAAGTVDPKRFVGLGLVLLVVALQAPGYAQSLAVDRLTPPLPTANERLAADGASWGMVVTAIALDTKASWDSSNRGRAFLMQGTRESVTFLAAYGLKKLVHRQRPCAPACGIDNPEFSFPSAHTAFAFSALPRGDTGPRLAFLWPLAFGTGAGRVMAGKHNLTDVLVGAGVGALTSRIR